MKNETQLRRVPLVPFECGQIWKMADSNVEIGLVGKRLVHYKYNRGQAKGLPVPNSLSVKNTLAKFLRDHQAILVKGEDPQPVKVG